jgi:hypothetical protein
VQGGEYSSRSLYKTQYISPCRSSSAVDHSPSPNPSSPAFRTHPCNPFALTSPLTLFLAPNTPSLLISPYVLFPNTSTTPCTPTTAATCTHAFHIPRLQIALAPLASNCLRPCSTPPINVSWNPGVHTALMLLLTTLFALRRENANSRAVVRTSKVWNLYPDFHIVSSTYRNRPERLNAR